MKKPDAPTRQEIEDLLLELARYLPGGDRNLELKRFVRCSRCCAPPGDPCRRPDGSVMEDLHHYRVEKYRQLLPMVSYWRKELEDNSLWSVMTLIKRSKLYRALERRGHWTATATSQPEEQP